ncbi:hypothetical protein OKW43_000853 [Paraburkholderia sp. WC7.3g]|uniref:Uncharacterized protein n=1 Tax=Paraburkholderia podalyriae TaxID=1938811 RepID=A0ABR7PKP1_9BURK|nr:hypothetical protein [Paraburkholderia podalyriae]MBC8746349.1 hypothetical protein [Paraburkholderia podalyriae]
MEWRRRCVAFSQPARCLMRRNEWTLPACERLNLTIRKSNGPVEPWSGNQTFGGALSFLFRRSRDGIDLAHLLARVGRIRHVAVRYKAA